MNMESSHEYINDFLYLLIRPDKSRGNKTLLYCSGINYDSFYPITKGRHRACANPAMRGLQLTNYEIMSLALSKGATSKEVKENLCAGTVPAKGFWHAERMVIENAPESLAAEIIEYAVINLMKKFKNSLMLRDEIPAELLTPDELQAFLYSLCDKYGGQEISKK